MSNKEQMMRQAEAEHQMNLPASAPSYEEAMRYPSIPQLPMEIPYQPQHPQPVIIQPQPVFNPQPIQPMPPPIQPQGLKKIALANFETQIHSNLFQILLSVHTIIHHNQRLGPESTKVTCPSCKMEIHTKVEYTPTMKTHIMAILLCIFG